MTVITCKRCVLTSADDPTLLVGADGICNHCKKYDENFPKIVLQGEAGKQAWAKVVAEMKAAGKGKKYDCILGISGGVDSTYLAYIAKEAGLRVLCVHLDNGWNSKEAVSNIKNIIKKLEYDLHTRVLNWEEFKNLQQSYFKAGVIDLDVPTDHAILTYMYQQAIENKISYFLSGHNYVTEAILPKNFNFDKGDAKNLANIHKKFGTVPLKNYPLFNMKMKYMVSYYYRLKPVRPLNLLPYDKKKVKEEIVAKLDWKDYGGKHYENIFTRFYQGYILPTRFGIDKRKAHLSNLICSGQITRQMALDELANPPYNPEKMESDRQYVLNKFGWTEEEFEALMKLPIVPHEAYGLETPWSHYLGFQFFRRKKE